jgi:hypothetical protein
MSSKRNRRAERKAKAQRKYSADGSFVVSIKSMTSTGKTVATISARSEVIDVRAKMMDSGGSHDEICGARSELESQHGR